MNVFGSIDLAARWPSLALAKRDVLRNVREQRLLLWTALFIAVASLAVLIGWPSDGAYLSKASQMAQRAFGILLTMWTLWAFVLVPSYAARGFVGEREAGTYDMLYLTLITPRGIVVAKAASAVGTFLMLLAATAPVAGTMFFIAGLDIRQFAFAFLVVGGTSLLCAAVGTACSAAHKRQGAALISSYVFTVVAMLMSSSARFPLGLMGGTFGVLAGVTFFAVIIPSVCFAIALPNSVPRGKFRTPVLLPPGPLQRGTNAVHPMIEPIDDGVNPIDARESRANGFAPGPERVRKARRALLAGAMVGVLMAFIGGVAMGLVNLFIAFMPALYLAGAVNREIEQGTFDSLRMSLLTPTQLLLGKTHAVLRKLKWVAVTLVVHVALFALLWGLVGDRPPWFLAVSFISMGGPLMLVSSLGGAAGNLCLSLGVGMFAASAARNTRTAQALAVGLVIFLQILSSTVSLAIMAVYAVMRGGASVGNPSELVALAGLTTDMRLGQAFLLFFVQLIPILSFGLALMFTSLKRIRSFWAADV